MGNYAERFAADNALFQLRYLFRFTLCFFDIKKIHLVNSTIEWRITNATGIIKASRCHRLTNQLGLCIQHPAVLGPRNFRTSKSISISRSSTNLRTWQLWDINMYTTALQSPKQTEKWPRVQETFHNWYRRLLRHTVRTFKTTCNVWARNNFKFMFQLMTVGLLNTEGFQN